MRTVYFLDGLDKPIAGTQANKNLFGSYLVLTLPVIFYLFLSSRKKPTRVAVTVLFAMGVITLFYIRSRASWLSALCTAIFFVSWLLLHQQHRLTIKKKL